MILNMALLPNWQTTSEQQDKAASQKRTGFKLAAGCYLLAVRQGLWIGTDYGQKQEGEALRRCDMILHSCLVIYVNAGG
jgi:hypothetical protein